MRTARVIGSATLLLALLPVCAVAQSLMVASPAIVIDEQSRTGTLTLINDGITPVEVSVSTFCGYPVTDSIGRMYLRTFATPDDTMPCAAKWIQSFPRRLRIDAKSRATVRLLVTPPPDLPPREYWARVMAAATGGQVRIGGLPDSAIQATLNVEIRSVVGLFYRRGNPSTGVTLDALRASPMADSLVGRVLLTRQGDAAFVGSLKASLSDTTGKVRSRGQLPLGVYYTLEPRFALPTAGLPAGRYTLSVEAVSSRPDLPADMLLPIVPVHQTVEVMLP
ncbi:MAG: hypothetical protein ACJ8DC_20060 [Gemmatimonadales bacterium]